MVTAATTSEDGYQAYKHGEPCPTTREGQVGWLRALAEHENALDEIEIRRLEVVR